MITMCLLFASAAAMQLTTPQFVAKHDANTTHKISAEAQEACENACGSEADVTCYTDCEVEVYQCYDVHIGNGKADEEEVFQKCKDEVLVKYQGFVALWEAKAMVALHRTNASGHGLAKDKCEGVCGADSICVTACEVGMYECFDTNTPTSEDKIDSCQEDILAKHKKVVAFWTSPQAVWLNIVKIGKKECSEACKDSYCVTECEVGMYECFDTNTPKSEDAIKKCQEGIVEKVKKTYAASFVNHHMLLVRHNSGDWQAHVVKAEMRHHINDKCNDVCGIDAQCVSSCEVEMYTCFDVNTPTSEDKIKQCQEDALKAHEKAREASLLAIQPKSFLAPSSI
jgi:hypothetical protein